MSFSGIPIRRFAIVAAIALVVVAGLWAIFGGGGSEVAGTEPSDGEASQPITPAPPLQCDDPITIGVVTDLSGGLRVLGTQLGSGVPSGLAYLSGGDLQLGNEQEYRIDDCDVRVVVRDDQSNPEVAELVARQLVDEGAVLLIGSVSPGTTAALREVAQDRDVALIAVVDTPNGLAGIDFDPKVFLLAPTPYQDAMATCEHWTGVSESPTFAQIAPDYPLGRRAATAFRDACTSLGGEFVLPDVLVDAGTTDFAGPLSRVGSADVLLATWTGGAIPQLLSDAAGSGVAEVSTPFPPNALLPLWFKDAEGMTSSVGYHFTAPANASNESLVEHGVAAGSVPDVFDARGMNAALLAIAGLRVADGATDVESLVAAIEGLRFAGPKGLVETRAEDHISIQDMYVVTLVTATDPGGDYYELVETVRPHPPCLLESEFAVRCGELPVGSLGG